MNGFDENWKNFLIENLKKCKIEISREQAEKFRIYGKELVEWNSKKNLTSIIGAEDIALLHFIDSLLAFKEFDLYDSKRLLDTGTGGGFPGIPLKLFFPELHVSLLDSSRKKISFLKYMTRTLGLKNVECINERAEEYSRKNTKSFDYVISRAFTSVEAFYDFVWPCVKPGGKIIAMKGPDAEDEILKLKSKKYEFMGVSVSGKDIGIKIRKYNLPVVEHERKIISLTQLYNVQ